MMALPVAGLALALAGRRQLGGAAWAAGVFVKWLPLLLLPLVAARDRRSFGWLGFGIAALGLAALSSVLYGFDWLEAATPISSQLQRASSTSVPFLVDDLLGLPQRRVTQGLAVLFALAYVMLLREAWRGRARLALTAGLSASRSLAPSLVCRWPVAFAAVEEDRAGRLRGARDHGVAAPTPPSRSRERRDADLPGRGMPPLPSCH